MSFSDSSDSSDFEKGVEPLPKMAIDASAQELAKQAIADSAAARVLFRMAFPSVTCARVLCDPPAAPAAPCEYVAGPAGSFSVPFQIVNLQLAMPMLMPTADEIEFQVGPEAFVTFYLLESSCPTCALFRRLFDSEQTEPVSFQDPVSFQRVLQAVTLCRTETAAKFAKIWACANEWAMAEAINGSTMLLAESVRELELAYHTIRDNLKFKGVKGSKGKQGGKGAGKQGDKGSLGKMDLSH